MVAAFQYKAFESALKYGDNNSRVIDGKRLERKILGALRPDAYDQMNMEIDELVKEMNGAQQRGYREGERDEFFEKYKSLNSYGKKKLIEKLLNNYQKPARMKDDVNLHMQWVINNQDYNEGNSSDPESEWMNDIHAILAEKLYLEDYNELCYYTAVDSILDLRHGIDAFFVLKQGDKNLVLTIDFTIGKSKYNPQVDLIFSWNEEDFPDDDLRDKHTFYLRGNKSNHKDIEEELNRLDRVHKKYGGIKSLFKEGYTIKTDEVLTNE